MDRIYEVVGFVAVLAGFGLVAVAYGSLPEDVPRHFGFDGEPTAYSSKGILWLLPSVGAAIYACLHWFKRRPDRFNYPMEVTAQNATALYQISFGLITRLNTITALLILFIVFGTVQSARSGDAQLNMAFVFGFVIWMFVEMISSNHRLSQASESGQSSDA